MKKFFLPITAIIILGGFLRARAWTRCWTSITRPAAAWRC